MIAQILHIPPEQQDRMSYRDFEDACDHLEESRAVQ